MKNEKNVKNQKILLNDDQLNVVNGGFDFFDTELNSSLRDSLTMFGKNTSGGNAGTLKEGTYKPY